MPVNTDGRKVVLSGIENGQLTSGWVLVVDFVKCDCVCLYRVKPQITGQGMAALESFGGRLS